MTKDIRLFLFDVFNFNWVPFGLFTAIGVGGWALKIDVPAILTGKIENRSMTVLCWVVIGIWLVFFLLSLDKALDLHQERKLNAEKANNEIEEKKKEQKHRDDVIQFQNEIKSKGVKLTEEQIDSLNSSNESKIQKAQISIQESVDAKLKKQSEQTDDKIQENMALLQSSINIIEDKLHAEKLAAKKELDREQKWSNHLANYIYQFSRKTESKRQFLASTSTL